MKFQKKYLENLPSVKSVLPLTPMLIQCLRLDNETKSLKKHFTQTIGNLITPHVSPLKLPI